MPFTPLDAVIWPPCLNRPLSHKFALVSSTISPGQTASASFPIGRFDGGGPWMGALNQILLRTDDDVRAYLAIQGLAQGGIVPLVVPCKPVMLAPWPVIDGQQITGYDPEPHSDGSYHSDGSGYSQPAIAASVTTDAILRATTISLTFLSVSPDGLRGGEWFSLNHPTQGWRMYRIMKIVSQAGGVAVVLIDPPLRDLISAGSVAEFDMPRCTMRLWKSDSLDLDLVTFPYPRPSAQFIEYLF